MHMMFRVYEVMLVPPVSAALSPQTVVELFYQTAARKIIISQLYSQQQQQQQQSNSLLNWSHMISNVVQLLAQLLYPSPAEQHAASGGSVAAAVDFLFSPVVFVCC